MARGNAQSRDTSCIPKGLRTLTLGSRLEDNGTLAADERTRVVHWARAKGWVMGGRRGGNECMGLAKRLRHSAQPTPEASNIARPICGPARNPESIPEQGRATPLPTAATLNRPRHAPMERRNGASVRSRPPGTSSWNHDPRPACATLSPSSLAPRSSARTPPTLP